MRIIGVVVIVLLLAGCPAQQRLYIHNKSDVTIASAYENPNWKEVVIRPGRTKWLSIRFGKESCFSVTIDEVTRTYNLPWSILVEAESKGYGSRIDVYYEYGMFNFQHDDGRWVQLAAVDECTTV